MEFVDPTQIKVLKASSAATPLISSGGGWTPIVMNTKVGPFRDVRVRQAMKLLADRSKLVKVAEQGFAQVGNDLFAIHDPLYYSSQGRRKYDPEKAKSLLKKAGHSDLKVTLDSSQATPDMLSSALLFAQSAKAGGVKVTVKKHPVDSFWSAVYGKSAFTHSSWGYRPFFPQWLQSLPGVQQGRDQLDERQGQQAGAAGRRHGRRREAHGARAPGAGDPVEGGRATSSGASSSASTASARTCRASSPAPSTRSGGTASRTHGFPDPRARGPRLTRSPGSVAAAPAARRSDVLRLILGRIAAGAATLLVASALIFAATRAAPAATSRPRRSGATPRPDAVKQLRESSASTAPRRCATSTGSRGSRTSTSASRRSTRCASARRSRSLCATRPCSSPSRWRC